MSDQHASSAHAQVSSAHRFWWLAPLALATCHFAMADVPRTNHRAANFQPSAQSKQSAARAAEGARESWQGKVLSDLIIDNQRWLFSIPLDVNPANPAETGANCGINQQGPVWNLIGPNLPIFTVNCDVPAGKSIFMPALGYFYEFPCPAPYPQLPPGQSLDAFLRGMTAEFVDGISFASITLDGKPVKLRRASTGIFPFTAAKDWVAYDSCITGAPQVAQADGLWALIDPPSVGRHTLSLKVTHAYGFSFDGTWILNITR